MILKIKRQDPDQTLQDYLDKIFIQSHSKTLFEFDIFIMEFFMEWLRGFYLNYFFL